MKLLYIGRTSKEKNILNLFKAITDSPYELDIVGNPAKAVLLKHQKYIDELHDYVSTHNVNIRYLGVIPHDKLPLVINMYKVFILVSYFEDSPKVLMEAMACERVCIGSNIPPIRELLLNCGIIVEHSPHEIRQGIDWAFSLSPYEKERLGKLARQKILDYNIERVFQKEVNLYESL